MALPAQIARLIETFEQNREDAIRIGSLDASTLAGNTDIIGFTGA
ncbi:MAG TPA: hypothetical protein VLI39_21865 [Sedimentisphaerales bacterium]|nr:hypothetical protein [Sedimentisphaerales bacterium]